MDLQQISIGKPLENGGLMMFYRILWDFMGFYGIYPPIIKHGNGKWMKMDHVLDFISGVPS